MKFASLNCVNFCWGHGILVYQILLFFPHSSGRGPDMTEILLTITLSQKNPYQGHFLQSFGPPFDTFIISVL